MSLLSLNYESGLEHLDVNASQFPLFFLNETSKVQKSIYKNESVLQFELK